MKDFPEHPKPVEVSDPDNFYPNVFERKRYVDDNKHAEENTFNVEDINTAVAKIHNTGNALVAVCRDPYQDPFLVVQLLDSEQLPSRP
jgi:hypothetical protein